MESLTRSSDNIFKIHITTDIFLTIDTKELNYG